MSAMCKLGGSCSKNSGLCGHEKMMLGIMFIAAVIGLVLWLG